MLFCPLIGWHGRARPNLTIGVIMTVSIPTSVTSTAAGFQPAFQPVTTQDRGACALAAVATLASWVATDWKECEKPSQVPDLCIVMVDYNSEWEAGRYVLFDAKFVE